MTYRALQMCYKRGENIEKDVERKTTVGGEAHITAEGGYGIRSLPAVWN